jgi:tRNA pseudouridine65 synthase
MRGKDYTARMPLPILYCDEHLVAVHKPAGMLVHPSDIDAAERSSALQALREQLRCRVYPLHRLDKPVAGVLLLALHADAARALGAVLASGRVRKTYVAVVRGHAPERGVIDYALREVRDAITDARARGSKPAQAAVTEYVRLHTAELPIPVGRYASARFSLLHLWPRTGRRHQLRRHLKHISHPILGDTTHGDGMQNRFARTHLACKRLLLCAQRVELDHPFGGARLSITAPFDSHFRGVVQGLGWDLSALEQNHPASGS